MKTFEQINPVSQLADARKFNFDWKENRWAFLQVTNHFKAELDHGPIEFDAGLIDEAISDAIFEHGRDFPEERVPDPQTLAVAISEWLGVGTEWIN